jgi:hypothetical protein
MAIKRLHYYNQQFLVESDFTDEQTYHLDMRRRLSRVLHTFGIGEGLEVQRTAANRQVTVKAGTAIDASGREIVLDADQVVDLGDLTAFPPSATVFITIAYQEAQTDDSTATGAPGKTRVTEAPAVQATTTAPPADGTVIRLARFDKTAAGDVPGNPNDFFDGGVRQPAGAKIAPGAVDFVNLSAALASKINTQSAVVSVDGVSSPGGNIDLVAANAVQLTPNNAARTITIGESHSSIVGNPHNTNASQLLGYDLRIRSFGTVSFTHADASGAVRTLPLSVTPRLIMAVSTVSAFLGTRAYGGGSFGFFDAAVSSQRCFGTGVTFTSNSDWFVRSAGVGTTGICAANFVDASLAPVRTEDLLVDISAISATGLTARLTRTSQNPFPPVGNGFTLVINLFYMGA